MRTFQLALALCVLGAFHVVRADTSDAPVDPVAAQAARDKAVADARKAEIDYLNAAVPKSGFTGSTDLKDNAGLLEGNVLTAAALSPIAQEIVKSISSHAKAEHVVIFSSTDKVDFTAIDLFNLQAKRLVDEFNSIPLPATDASTRPSVRIAPLAVVPLLSSLASYFKSDYQVGGTSIPADETQLIAAIIHAKGDLSIYLPPRIPGLVARTSVTEKLFELDALAGRARLLVSAAENEKGSTNDGNGKKASETKPKLGSDDERTTKAKNALAHYQVFGESLAAAEDKSPISLGAVMRQSGLDKAMGDEGYGLFVHVQSMAGGHFTKKNLWTFFGKMPFYVSGGAVVGYTLIQRSNGEAVAADVLASACAYVQASDVVGTGSKSPQCALVGHEQTRVVDDGRGRAKNQVPRDMSSQSEKGPSKYLPAG